MPFHSKRLERLLSLPPHILTLDALPQLFFDSPFEVSGREMLGNPHHGCDAKKPPGNHRQAAEEREKNVLATVHAAHEAVDESCFEDEK